jgi:8-oxoguanine deaminase
LARWRRAWRPTWWRGRWTTVGLAGGLHDPLAALLLCHVPRVALNVINGRVCVRDGELATLELPRLVREHNRLARELLTG